MREGTPTARQAFSRQFGALCSMMTGMCAGAGGGQVAGDMPKFSIEGGPSDTTGSGETAAVRARLPSGLSVGGAGG